MERITQLLSRAQNCAASLSPGVRVTIAVAMCIVVGSIGIAVHQHESTTQLLFDGRTFNDAELQRIEIAFGKAGLTDYKITNRRIQVPAAQYGQYVAAFDATGIKDPISSYVTEEVNRNSLFETARQKEERIRRATERDLVRNIRSLPGIHEADVHINVRRTGGLRQEVSVSASVSLRCEPDCELDEATAQTIRVIVSSSDPNLKPQDVSVVDLTSLKTFAAGTPIEAVSATSAASHRRHTEDAWQQKLLESLRHYGVTKVVVHLDESHQQIESESIRAFAEIPFSYYKNHPRIHRKQSRNAALNQLKQVRQINESRIRRIVKGVCPNARITISVYDDQSATPPATSTRTWPKAIWIGGLLLAAFGFIGFRLFQLRRTNLQPSKENSNASPFETTTAEPVITIELREKLTTAVRSNPDAAAKIIQSWLKEAG